MATAKKRTGKNVGVEKATKAPAKANLGKAARAPEKAKASSQGARASATAAPKATAAKPAKPASKAAPAKAAKALASAPAKAGKPAPKAAASKATRKAGGARVDVGSAAPAFSLIDQGGRTVTSAELAGKPYVLYFYPKDDTPGCTTEACNFRDSEAKFGKRGLRIIGVSPDQQSSHQRFAEKYGLSFTLLSDPEKQLIQAYGSWVEKQNYGRTYMGVERSTFLIGADGKVKQAWRGVRVPGHVDAVLAAEI